MMDLVFTVVCREPLTKTEEQQVRRGVSINPGPILRRWGIQNGWDDAKMKKDVAYVEDPSGTFQDGLIER